MVILFIALDLPPKTKEFGIALPVDRVGVRRILVCRSAVCLCRRSKSLCSCPKKLIRQNSRNDLGHSHCYEGSTFTLSVQTEKGKVSEPSQDKLVLASNCVQSLILYTPPKHPKRQKPHGQVRRVFLFQTNSKSKTGLWGCCRMAIFHFCHPERSEESQCFQCFRVAEILHIRSG